MDDNELARTAIGNHLGSHSVEYAGDLETAAGKLEAEHYDICFIDLKLGRGDEYSGLKLIPLAVSNGRTYRYTLQNGLDNLVKNLVK